jgi:hypothetical protein
MSLTKIEKLTPSQEALIPVYREKWRAIALSTEPIDRQKAAEAVNAAYQIIGYLPPQIVFCDSPNAALSRTRRERSSEVAGQLGTKLRIESIHRLSNQLGKKLNSDLTCLMWSQLRPHLWEQLNRQLKGQLGVKIDEGIQPELWACNASIFDFCISVLNCSHSQKEWQVYRSLIENCGWFFPFERVCYVCDRPRILSFDNQQRLHAIKSPAIQFADGFSIYAYHGVRLPEKYGALHPNQWQAKWLLEEDNAELRRVLIQGIGYARICQELQATELDTWLEYTLLRIDSSVDVEPIHLLKMTCPSTGYVHAMRVPPDIESARAAIRWVNWGTDSEEFSVQT